MYLRTIKALLLSLGLALCLGAAACGVRGPLEPPPGAVKAEGPVLEGEEKPSRGFILDGLLD